MELGWLESLQSQWQLLKHSKQGSSWVSNGDYHMRGDKRRPWWRNTRLIYLLKKPQWDLERTLDRVTTLEMWPQRVLHRSKEQCRRSHLAKVFSSFKLHPGSFCGLAVGNPAVLLYWETPTLGIRWPSTGYQISYPTPDTLDLLVFTCSVRIFSSKFSPSLSTSWALAQQAYATMPTSL